MRIFKRIVTALTLVTSLALFDVSRSASAVTIFDVFTADAGVYAPFTLGTDLNLDACGSSFASYNLCSGPDISDIEFSWQVTADLGVTTSSLGSGLGIAGALLTVTTGGIADVINTAGSYIVILNLTAPATSLPFALGDGNEGSVNFLFNPSGNSSSAFSPTFVVSVPEPAAALLLLPAVVYIGRRQRKRRQLQAA